MTALRILVGGWLLALAAAAVQGAEVEDYSRTIQVFQESAITRPFFDNAYGYVVFPKVGKGGAVIGGAFGKGQVYCAGTVTGEASLYQLSIGMQIGGETYSEIIFFQDQRAYDEFTSGDFALDATVSAVAITAAAQTTIGTTGKSAGASVGPHTGKQLAAEYVKGMAVFTHIKGGLMYEASVGGQKFTFKPLK